MKTNETTKQTAQRVLNTLLPCAAAIVATGQEHAPMLALDWRSGQKSIAALPPLPKDAVAFLHREAAKRAEIEAATLIMEAWMGTFDAGQEKAAQAVLDGKITVSELPAREECILFNIRVGTDQFIAACKIDRATNTLGEVKWIMDGTQQHSEGRFVGDGDQAAQRARRMAN